MEEQQPLTTSESLSQKARKAGESIERSTRRIEDDAVEQIKGVRARLEASVDNRRSQTVYRAHSVGSALRQASENLENDDPVVHDVLDYASDSVERVADYLSHVSFAELRDDVESFARRRPALFFGGAVLLGLAAGRVLKSAASTSLDETDDERAMEEPPLITERAKVVQGNVP